MADIATIDPGLIDSNRWYSLYINQNKTRTLGCIYKPGTKSGAITIPSSAPSDEKQRWQIYPLNATTYVIRNQHGGPGTFLGAFFASQETAEGKTRPRLARGDIAEDSVYWTFGKWGDGTYWMSNAANGTDWHFNIAPDNAMTMSRDIVAPQNGQRWGFEAVALIDDPTFSSVDLLGATVTSPNTATTSLPTSAPTASSSGSPENNDSSSSPSSSSSSSGLSTAAKAGIGAGVGGVALIALVLLGLFLFRRRKQRPAVPHETAYEPYQSAPPAQVSEQQQSAQLYDNHEMHNDSSTAKYEMPAPVIAEVEANGKPVELPGAPVSGGR